MPVPNPYTGALSPIVAAQLGLPPAAPYVDATGVTTTSVLVPGFSEQYVAELASKPYAPIAQIFAAGAAPVLAGASTVVKSLASLVPALGGKKMDFLATTGLTDTGANGGWFHGLMGLASQAITAFAPQNMPTLTPEQQAQNALSQFGLQNLTQNIPNIAVQALNARCATTAGMSSLPCVVHQKGPYAGKLVKTGRRRKLKLVPDGSGSLTPVICCTPRRMNPLNARALSRAARRLAMFTHIVGRVEKQVQKSFRRHGGRIRHTAVARRRCGATPCRCGRC